MIKVGDVYKVYGEITKVMAVTRKSVSFENDMTFLSGHETECTLISRKGEDMHSRKDDRQYWRVPKGLEGMSNSDKCKVLVCLLPNPEFDEYKKQWTFRSRGESCG